MVMLVTLERAKSQEYIIHDAYDAEVAAKAEEASDIVLDYLGRRDNPDEWTDETVPGTVRAAVLLTFGALWENRDGGEDGPEPLSTAVKSLLRRYRDPVLA